MKQLPISSYAYLCENTKISEKHQRLFGSSSEQLNYFKSKAKYTFQNMTYIRSNDYLSGSIKIPAPFTGVLTCDYIAFSNPDITKVFYGQITNRKYIDALTTEVSFKVDAFQTFMFDYQIASAFTEREHVAKANDKVGVNTESEPALFDDIRTNVYRYTLRDFVESNDLILMMYVKPASPLAQATNLIVPILNSVPYDGDVYAYPFTAAGITKLQTRINQLLALDAGTAGINQWQIDRIYIIPNVNNMLNLTFADNEYKFDGNYNTLFSQHAVQQVVTLPDTPFQAENQKVYQQPFTEIQISTSGGTSIKKIDLAKFPMKLTGGLPNVKLVYSIDFNPYPSFVIWLNSYNGVAPIEKTFSGSTVELDPEFSAPCALPEINMNQITNIGVGIGQLAGIFLARQGAMAGGVQAIANPVLQQPEKEDTQLDAMIQRTANDYLVSTGQVQPTINDVTFGGSKSASVLSNVFDSVPPMIPGTVQIGGNVTASGFTTGLSLGVCGVYLTMNIVRDVQSYDEFFTRYGYAVNRLKAPELNTRSAWNFVKTKENEITGNLPYQAKAEIQSMFNAGVTLWHTNDILNYGQANN